MVFGDTFIHKNCVQKRSKWIIQLRFSHELVTTKRILLTWRYLLPFVKWPVTIKVYTLYLKLNDVWMTLWVFMQTLPYISQLLSLFRVPSQDKGWKRSSSVGPKSSAYGDFRVLIHPNIWVDSRVGIVFKNASSL